MAREDYEIYLDCSIEQLKEDVVIGLHNVLDSLQIGLHGVDMRLSLFFENENIVVYLINYLDNVAKTATSTIDKERFLKMTMDDFGSYIFDVCYCNMFDSEQ